MLTTFRPSPAILLPTGRGDVPARVPHRTQVPDSVVFVDADRVGYQQPCAATVRVPTDTGLDGERVAVTRVAGGRPTAATGASPTRSGVVFEAAPAGRHPVAGADIALDSADSVVATTRSAATGRDTFCSLPTSFPGFNGFEVSAEPSGYQPTAVVIPFNGDTVLDLELKRCYGGSSREDAYAGVKRTSHMEGKRMTCRSEQQTRETARRQTGTLDRLGGWRHSRGLGVLVVGGLLCGGLAQAAPFAYIPYGWDGTVAVIDTATNTWVATVPVGMYPQGVAVHPDGSKVYVANNFSNSVSVINTATNTVVATVPVGVNPLGVAVHPDGSKVYVATDCGVGCVFVIDTTTNTVVATVVLVAVLGEGGPWGVAVHPDGSKVYVTTDAFACLSNSVSVINTATNTVVATVPAGLCPSGVAVHPTRPFVYVANKVCCGNDIVSVIDTTTNTVVATVRVGDLPSGVAVHPDGSKVYVVASCGGPLGCFGAGTVSVMDTATNTVVATVPVGMYPQGVAVHPDGSKVYVANSDTVSVIDTATNTVVGAFLVGPGPMAFGQFVGPLPPP